MRVKTAVAAALVAMAVVVTGCSRQDQANADRADEKARAEAHRLGTEAKKDAQRLKEEIQKGMNGSVAPNTADASRKLHEAGRIVDQAALVAQVKAKLANDVGMSSISSVRVDSSGSLITLSGTIATADQKRAAETAAREVNGVTQVVNQLTVQP